MKTYTITGYNRSNKAMMSLDYTTDDFTVKMADTAMKRIQTFFATPLRFTITETLKTY